MPTEKQLRQKTAAREAAGPQVGDKATPGSIEEKLIQEELNMKGTRNNPLW